MHKFFNFMWRLERRCEQAARVTPFVTAGLFGASYFWYLNNNRAVESSGESAAPEPVSSFPPTKTS